jgi:hypothetical protein
MSPEGEYARGGFLLQSSAHNLSVRLSRTNFDVRSPFPFFRTYREMAIANGVAANDPALRAGRDDGGCSSIPTNCHPTNAVEIAAPEKKTRLAGMFQDAAPGTPARSGRKEFKG